MSEDRTHELTDHEVQEKIRARKQRTRWGSAIAVVGILAALVFAFWRESYGMTALFLGVGLVGAGFVDPALLGNKLLRK